MDEDLKQVYDKGREVLRAYINNLENNPWPNHFMVAMMEEYERA
jgi:hypothetical protein